jgi:hypothetical protein
VIHAEAVRVRRGACARPRVWQAASEKGGLFKAEPFESYESSYSFSKDQRETKKKHFFMKVLVRLQLPSFTPGSPGSRPPLPSPPPPSGPPP